MLLCLPPELQAEVLYHLDVPTALSLSETCRTLHALVTCCDPFWREKYRRRWSEPTRRCSYPVYKVRAKQALASLQCLCGPLERQLYVSKPCRTWHTLAVGTKLKPDRLYYYELLLSQSNGVMTGVVSEYDDNVHSEYALSVSQVLIDCSYVGGGNLDVTSSTTRLGAVPFAARESVALYQKCDFFPHTR